MTHRVDLGGVPNSPRPKLPGSAAAMLEECPFRRLTPWSKLLILKNLIGAVNGSSGDPGHCNSNAGYLFSPTDAVTA
jgi:hypothetical protein